MSATVRPITDANVTQALEVIEFFSRPGDVVEIRALCVGRNAGYAGATYSGYFNRENTPALIKAIRSVDGKSEGVYFTINKVNPKLLARAHNRLQARAKHTTADADILERRWLYTDVDSVRPAGISATEEERQAAHAVAKEIQGYLAELGWPEPFYADSGNGAALFHLLPAMDMEKADRLVKQVLEAIAARFSNPAVNIDTGTANRGASANFSERWPARAIPPQIDRTAEQSV